LPMRVSIRALAWRAIRDSPEAQTAKNTSKLVSLIERLIQEQTNQEVIEI